MTAIDLKPGDKVRMKRGTCGEGFAFYVASVNAGQGGTGLAGSQVYGEMIGGGEYGPVLVSDVELIQRAPVTAEECANAGQAASITPNETRRS